MFYRATSFDQNIGGWDITAVMSALLTLSMESIFAGVALSTANYDALLQGWSQQAVQEGITFDAGDSQYSSGAPADARQTLIDEYDWSITDGGPAP